MDDRLIFLREALTLNVFYRDRLKIIFGEQTLILISRYSLKNLKKLLRKQTLTLLTARPYKNLLKIKLYNREGWGGKKSKIFFDIFPFFSFQTFV